MQIIDHGFTIFKDIATAQALADENAKSDPDTDYQVFVRTDGGVVVAMYEDGEFQMCL